MSDEINKLQEKFDEAVGELRSAKKEVEKRGVELSEHKEKFEKLNRAFEAYETENQKLVARVAEQEKRNAELKDAEERIKELETRIAKIGSVGSDPDIERKVKLVEEVRNLRMFCEGKEHEVEKRYMRSDSNIDGGFLMKESYNDMILKPVNKVSNIRQFANVKRRSTLTNNFVVENTPAVAYWTGENQDPTQSHSQYGNRAIQLERLTTASYATLEALMAPDWDTESEITEGHVRARLKKEGNAFVEGDGARKPWGLVSRLVADARLYASGSSSALTTVNLLKMTGEIEGYNPMWAFNNRTLATIRTLQDPGGDLSFAPGNIAAGMPNQIGGYSYAIMPDMDDVGSNTYPVFFGDIRECYTICDGMEAIMTRIFNRKGGYEFLMYYWVGADVVMPEAGIVMKCATSV